MRVDEHALLMVSVKELLVLTNFHMSMCVLKWIVFDYQSTSISELLKLLPRCVKVEIIDDEKGLYSPLCGVGHLLEGNCGDHFMIHIIGCNKGKIFRIVYMLPELVPENI